MKFNNILKEYRVSVTGSTRAGKKMKLRGISIIILDESLPPDVHGIPKDMEAYGRGGFTNNSLWIDGGPSGSSNGHPNFIHDGFYWGADYDKNELYIRGRAGTNIDIIEKNLEYILEQIFPRLPK